MATVPLFGTLRQGSQVSLSDWKTLWQKKINCGEQFVFRDVVRAILLLRGVFQASDPLLILIQNLEQLAWDHPVFYVQSDSVSDLQNAQAQIESQA